MKAAALIPCAGIGERFGAAVPKPLVDLCGKPIIAHTLSVLEKVSSIEEIVLVVHPDYVASYEDVFKRFPSSKIRTIVAGGENRTQSVRNGLKALQSEAKFVIVHDGVRPLVSVETIEHGLELVPTDRAVVAAVPVKATVKIVDPHTHIVRETINRSLVWEIQTPQIFERELFTRAYTSNAEATDDAALVERLGVKVKVFMGDYRNIKITTPEDLKVAQAFMKELS